MCLISINSPYIFVRKLLMCNSSQAYLWLTQNTRLFHMKHTKIIVQHIVKSSIPVMATIIRYYRTKITQRPRKRNRWTNRINMYLSKYQPEEAQSSILLGTRLQLHLNLTMKKKMRLMLGTNAMKTHWKNNRKITKIMHLMISYWNKISSISSMYI